MFGSLGGEGVKKITARRRTIPRVTLTWLSARHQRGDGKDSR